MAAPSANGQRPLRLLSLDGGGIRGLSSIIILKEIMRQVNRGVPADQHLLPWQVFDLIGGTSTGGIIAIMLGRLRMSLKECEEAYLKLGKDIFEPKRARWDGRRLVDFVQANEKFDSSILESSIKAIIGEKTGDENSPLKPLNTPEDGDCKVFLCSVLEVNSEPVFLRTYESGSLADPLSDDFALWQALRATSAASTFFDAYQHGVKKFVDGGFAYNNPVQRVMIEAADLWGTDRPTALISIGTGESLGESLGGNLKKLAQSMIKLVTQTERTADDFYSSHRIMVDGGMYFRFNVPGLATIGMQEYKEVHAIDSHTIAYLTKGTTSRDLSAVVGKIKDIRATDDLDSTYLKITHLDKQDQECIRALFLRAGDYESHREELDQPVEGTCSWIFQHPKFVHFREDKGPSLLWVTGNPGCGKSMLARFLADQLGSAIKDKNTTLLPPIVCSFFFKDGQDRRTEPQSAISALLHQLFIARPNLSRFGRAEYAAKGNDFTQSAETVWRIICEACSQIPQRQVICIVDALDECSDHSRNRFIRTILSTFSAPNAKKTAGSLKVLVTSRPRPEIEAEFGPNSTIRLRGEDETRALARSIGMVVDQCVHDLEKNNILTPETGEMVKNKLKREADGTFLWTSLVLKSIRSLGSRTPYAIERRLAEIPKDLYAFYDHALPEFDDWTEIESSRRLLGMLLAATRPLSLHELGICLSLDPATKRLHDMKQEPDIGHTVKSFGGFFVRIARQKVSLVHQTAREYLLRGHNTMPGRFWKHSIGFLESNLTLAWSCVRFLLLEDWTEYLEGVGKYRPDGHVSHLSLILPDSQSDFYQYAATQWFRHVSASSANNEPPPELRKAIHMLCDRSKIPFALWWEFNGGPSADDEQDCLEYAAKQGNLVVLREFLSISMVDKPRGDAILTAAAGGNQDEEVIDWILSRFNSEPPITGEALKAAILRKNISLTERFMTKGEVNLNGRYSGDTLLKIAVDEGEMAIIELLVERGASVCDEEAFVVAAMTSRKDIMKFLLENLRDDDSKKRAEKRAKLLLRALETTVENRIVGMVELIMNMGLTLPHRCSLPFQLVDAARKRINSEVKRLIGDDVQDERGIALVLGSHGPEILDLLLNTQNYDMSQIWRAFRCLDWGTARLYRKLLATRPEFDRSPQQLLLLETKGSRKEEDECLQLFLRRLTGLKTRFSNHAITHFLTCVSDMDNSRRSTFIDLLNTALLETTPETAAFFVTLASICGATDVIYGLSWRLDINLKDGYGMTPLLAAVLAKSTRLISYLLKHGASLGTISWYRASQSSAACKEPQEPLAIDLEYWDRDDDWSSLFIAGQRRTDMLTSMYGTWESIWTILGKDTFIESPLSLGQQYAIEPFSKRRFRATLSLMKKSSNNRRPEVAEYALGFLQYKRLFEKRVRSLKQPPGYAFVDDLDLSSFKQLSYAFFDDIPASLVLQASYAPKWSRNGRTALHLAAKKGLNPLILKLIQYGQSAAAVDEQGKTPLHLYTGSDIDTVKTMLGGGGSLDAVDNAGCTPLHTSLNTHRASARVFIKLGSPVDTKTKEGRTPLHEATLGYVPLSVVESLVGQGAAPLARDARGLTPLHYAIQTAKVKRTIKIVEFLMHKIIRTGESLAIKYDDGLTMIEFAEKTRQEIVGSQGGEKEVYDVVEYLGRMRSWGHSGLDQGDICDFYEKDVASDPRKVNSGSPDKWLLEDSDVEMNSEWEDAD